MSRDANAELDRPRLQVQSLKVESGIPNVSIGNYLLTRLEQLGVTVSNYLPKRNRSSVFLQAMFGVPGDFNLGFLVS